MWLWPSSSTPAMVPPRARPRAPRPWLFRPVADPVVARSRRRGLLALASYPSPRFPFVPVGVAAFVPVSTRPRQIPVDKISIANEECEAAKTYLDPYLVDKDPSDKYHNHVNAYTVASQVPHCRCAKIFDP